MTIDRYEKKVKQIAVAPDGTEFTRTSDRVYRYVVVVRVDATEKRPAHWGHLEWASRRDLAEGYVRKWSRLIDYPDRGSGIWRELAIVEVQPATKE